MRSSRKPPAEPSKRNARRVLAVGGAALALAGLYFVRFGRLNQDEGIYLYAARLVAEGQLPFRDFSFFQAPLVLIVHALPQWLAPGIETGRWTSFALGSLTSALTLRLAYARGGTTAVAVVAGGLIGAPLAIWALVSTRTEPLIALCLLVVASCLARPEPKPSHRAIAVVAAVLATTARISSAPAALFVVFWALRPPVRNRSDAARILAPGLVVAVAVAALVLSDGLERGWFQLVGMQSQRYQQLGPTPWSVSLWLSSKGGFLLGIGREFGVVPVLSCLATLGFAIMWLWHRARGGGGDRTTPAGPLSALALLAWAPNLVPLMVYPVYLVSVLPLVLVLGGWGLAAAQQRWLGPGVPARRAAVAGALVGLALAQAPTLLARHDRWAARTPTDLDELRSVARDLESLLPADRQLFSFDTYLAVESRRRLPPGLEFGFFSWFPQRDEADGERLGLLTTERLLTAIAAPEVGAVAVSDEVLGILALRRFWGYQPRRRLTERQLWQAYPPLQSYDLAHVVPSFGPRSAPLYLLTRKPPP